MERKYLDKYNVLDDHGYGVETEDGIFRPLDLDDGDLIVQGSTRHHQVRRQQELDALAQVEHQVYEWRELVQLAKKKAGRPRKNLL